MCLNLAASHTAGGQQTAYAKAREAAKSGAPNPGMNPPWEAMLPVLRGEVPLTIHADELRQIRAAVKWAETNGFKITLAGGRDAGAALVDDPRVALISATIPRERIEGALDILKEGGRSVEHTLARTVGGLGARIIAKIASVALRLFLRRFFGIDVLTYTVST